MFSNLNYSTLILNNMHLHINPDPTNYQLVINVTSAKW